MSAARAAALLVLFGLAAGPVDAFEVSPMRVEMSPSGSGASTVITVRNTLAEPLAIEVFATDRIVAEDGSQTFEPNEDDFLLFPPQAFIQPGEAQGFRVQYIGDPDPDETRSYVVNLSQVPLNTFDGAGVQVVYQFGAAIYVHPEGSTPAVAVEAVSAKPDRVDVKVNNSGNRVAFLTNDRIVISTPSGASTFEWEDLAKEIDNPIIPPHGARVLSFSTPGVKPGAAVDAVIYPRDD